ncbi:putative tRNA pseudouridine synthase 10 [Giardia muris]|uniref:tRNA pseudouridine(55) synthase n=1 Tax=Giardia muris TaxID=5742 RepID=A0A4Z1SPN0_GIAMU|nr:putative tRNA pseudouridine synthase 10 [Giardia muris]|eukprot:TNJ27610.1 putative tRNA pseudouridine synthase 10 [Giardia muris]
MADAGEENAVAAHLLAQGVCRFCVLRFLGRDDPDAFQRAAAEGAGADADAGENSRCPTCLGILPRVAAPGFCEAVVGAFAAAGFVAPAFLLTVATPACLIPRDALALHELFGCRTCDGAVRAADGEKGASLRARLAHVVPVKRALKLLLGPRLSAALRLPVAADAPLRYALVVEAAGLPPVELPKQLVDSRRRRDHAVLRRRGVPNDAIVTGALTELVRDAVDDHALLAALCRARTPLRLADDPRVLFRGALERDPVFVAARYLKLQRYLPQTGDGEDTEAADETEAAEENGAETGAPADSDGAVSGALGGSVAALIQPAFIRFGHADGATFHAAGREDVDVRMRGDGRPFLVELRNSRDGHLRNWAAFEAGVAGLEANGPIAVVGPVKVVDSATALKRLSEGSADKQKTYRALCWASRSLPDAAFEALASISELQIAQQTPLRVLHRRTLLRRARTITQLRLEKRLGTRYFVLTITAQAGTYIKEFCNGDCGRTRPALGDLLGADIEILQLDVVEVEMAWPP